MPRTYYCQQGPYDELHHTCIELSATENAGGVLLLWEKHFDPNEDVDLLSMEVGDFAALSQMTDLIQRFCAWQKSNPSAPTAKQVCLWMDELGFQEHFSTVDDTDL